MILGIPLRWPPCALVESVTAYISLKGPIDRHKAFLDALGLDSSVFLDPDGKCIPIIPLFLVRRGEECMLKEVMQ